MNFDELIDRRNTNSVKYDFHHRYNKNPDALPMWIADMDFRVPQAVTEAIQRFAAFGVYGYTEPSDDYFRAVAGWFGRQFDYCVKQEWLVKTPGVVFALGALIRALTAEGDAIVIQKPLYPPIEYTIRLNNRVAVDNPLVYADGVYSIDIADFEKKISESKAKMLILCNPHNPVGRVWTRNELLEMGRVCQKYDCIVVSDEIHCDLVFEGNKHLVFSTVCEEFEDFSVICTAPSKTFNLAGLQNSNIFIANEKTREKFKGEILASGYHQLNTLGLRQVKPPMNTGAAGMTNCWFIWRETRRSRKSFLRKNSRTSRRRPLRAHILCGLTVPR